MFDKFFSLFSHDIGIDLGTANTLVWVRGKGIVIHEPSIVARHKRTKQVIAIGTEAKKMFGKTPATIETIRPLRGGVISDFDATAAMIAHYIKKVHEMKTLMPRSFIRPKVAIGIPSSVTEVERRAVWEAALMAGAREAYLIEEPMAAAIGAEVSVFAPTGVMIVDIGGGTTEIAIISLGGIVVGKSFKLAGDEMDKAIVHYIRLRHGLLLGEKTAEDIKIKIGSAYEKKIKNEKSEIRNEKLEMRKEKDKETEGKNSQISSLKSHLDSVMIVRGRDIESGLPKSLKVNEVEIREALAPILAEITEAIGDVLEEAPPELTSDILEHGILLTGGGALLPGMDSLIMDRTHIPVMVAQDPLTTVVRGTGKVLEDFALLTRVKVVGGLK